MPSNKKSDLQQILDNGGATLNKNGAEVSFKNGYQVSKKDCFILNAKNIDDISDAVDILLKNLKRNEYCGIWVDGADVYIDISEKINDKKTALYIGRKRNQKSIYEWSTGNCIECGGV